MPSMNTALEGDFYVNGVKATPALQLIKERYEGLYARVGRENIDRSCRDHAVTTVSLSTTP